VPDSTPKIGIFGDITDEKGAEWCASIYKAHRDLEALKDPQTLRINIGSTGGDTRVGQDIHSAILTVRRMGRKVHVHCTSIAYSSAMFIMQAATVRTAEQYSTFLIHTCSYDMGGSPSLDVHIDTARGSLLEMDLIWDVYERRSKLTKTQLKRLISRKDKYLSATKALELGMIDAILPAP
jgi:ATP-dependent protease ClpP protease subunit